jgi:hypothetical protein
VRMWVHFCARTYVYTRQCCSWKTGAEATSSTANPVMKRRVSDANKISVQHGMQVNATLITKMYLRLPVSLPSLFNNHDNCLTLTQEHGSLHPVLKKQDIWQRPFTFLLYLLWTCGSRRPQGWWYYLRQGESPECKSEEKKRVEFCIRKHAHW